MGTTETSTCVVQADVTIKQSLVCLEDFIFIVPSGFAVMNGCVKAITADDLHRARAG